MTKENAEYVGAHLVMAGRLTDTDPDLAYRHAEAAVKRAGRIDIVREAAGITAYLSGRYGDALRELRAHRRLSGSVEHLPIIADAERGRGRPEKAIALGRSEEAQQLSVSAKVELAIVISGARLDLADAAAALAALRDVPALHPKKDRALIARLSAAQSTALSALGRESEAEQALLRAVTLDPSLDPNYEGDAEGHVIVIDTEETEPAEAGEATPR